MDIQHICNQTIELSKIVGNFIRIEKAKITEEIIESKGIHNYVTYVDKTAERMLVDGLKTILPESDFIVEEGTSNENGAEYTWIVDPLDGTTNFIHGLPPFAISIALRRKDKIIIGIIYEIIADECFYAYENSKAYLNGKEIKVSTREKVSDSLIATGFPYYDYGQLPQFMKTLEFFMRNSHGIRRIGSAATDLAYVACGRFEAFYEYGLSPWDVAAGAFIVEQAGGKVCDFSGKTDWLFGKEIISSNNLVFNEFKEIINNFMKI